MDYPFVLICCAFNAEQYISHCIKSCLQQADDVGVIVIDDGSRDATLRIAEQYSCNRLRIVKNEIRTGSAALNQYNAVRTIVEDPEAICGIVDADDFLYWFSVQTIREQIGDNWMFCSNNHYGLKSKLKPEYSVNRSSIPDFNTNIRRQPWKFEHFRGFKKKLSDKVRESSFYYNDGSLIRAGSDLPYFYSMMEMAGPERIKHVDEVLYYYNMQNPINDFRVNLSEQSKCKVYQKGVDSYDKIEML